MPIFYKLCISALSFFLVGASVFRTLGWYIHDIYWAQEYLGGDKTTHVIAGALIMHTSQLWLNSPLRWKRLVVSVVIILFVLLGEELSQQFLNNRIFSVEDFAASMAGVLLTTLFSVGYLWLQPQIPKRQLK